MDLTTAEDAIETYKTLGDWQYADREATWKWMFEQGVLAGRGNAERYEPVVWVLNGQLYEVKQHNIVDDSEIPGQQPLHLDELLAECREAREGWEEAAIAWEVCASIHETWAKGKDALYSTRHADFERHAADARRRLSKDRSEVK